MPWPGQDKFIIKRLKVALINPISNGPIKQSEKLRYGDNFFRPQIGNHICGTD